EGGQVGLDAPDLLFDAYLDDGGAGDSFWAGEDLAGGHLAAWSRSIGVAHNEDVGRVRLSDETAGVEHEGVVGAGIVGFDLSENGIEQIRVVNFAIENFRGRLPDLARDQ